MRKFYNLLLISIILNGSVSFADLKNAVQDATSGYLQNHFLNASFMFESSKEVIVLGAHGFSNLEGGNMMPDRQMPIASITKSMTAVSILKLQERKLLNVHDKVVKYLGGMWTPRNIPKWAQKVTIHNLLTHTSGLAEYITKMKIDIKKTHNDINKAIINFASTEPGEFIPGSRYQYCNTNFVLLGLIIEKVSGVALSDFFNKELFIPLDMKSTHLASLEEALKIQDTPWDTPYPERYFVIPNGSLNPIFNPVDTKNVLVPYADGGVISNVSDLIKWHKALHEGQLLSDASYKLMTTRYMETPSMGGDKSYIGYGLFITELSDKEVMYNHRGGAIGIRSESGYIPSRDFYFAILSNVMQYIPEDMKSKIDMNKPENQLDIYYFKNAILKAIAGS